MMNYCKILRTKKIILSLLIVVFAGALAAKSSAYIQPDSFRRSFIRQVKPYVQSIDWVKNLVKEDTARSVRTRELAPLAQIDDQWMQRAYCAKKVSPGWVRYYSSSGMERSLDLLPHYFFYNHQICYVLGFMANDSLAVMLGLVNYDTTIFVMNTVKFGGDRSSELLFLRQLSKKRYSEPKAIFLFKQEQFSAQELPEYLLGAYKNKGKSVAVIKKRTLMALDRMWLIRSISKIDASVSGGYRIFAVDEKTRRPGYFVFSDTGLRNFDWKWTLSLTLERSRIAGHENFTILGVKKIKGRFDRIHTWYRLRLVLLANFLIIFFSLMFGLFYGKKKKRKHQRTQMALTGLRAQLNPHFLFNALTSIQDLMNQDNKPAANRYFNEMAQLMRYVVDSSEEEYTPLYLELAALEKYCSLEALRTPFDYTFDIREEIDVTNTEIPTMLLQPFVENAILHGLRPSDQLKQLSICMWPEGGDRIGISIMDTGIGMEAARKLKGDIQRSHQGLLNIQKRIELLNQGRKQKISLRIDDRSLLKPNQTGTLIQLSIPI